MTWWWNIAIVSYTIFQASPSCLKGVAAWRVIVTIADTRWRETSPEETQLCPKDGVTGVTLFPFIICCPLNSPPCHSKLPSRPLFFGLLFFNIFPFFVFISLLLLPFPLSSLCRLPSPLSSHQFNIARHFIFQSPKMQPIFASVKISHSGRRFLHLADVHASVKSTLDHICLRKLKPDSYSVTFLRSFYFSRISDFLHVPKVFQIFFFNLTMSFSLWFIWNSFLWYRSISPFLSQVSFTGLFCHPHAYTSSHTQKPVTQRNPWNWFC